MTFLLLLKKGQLFLVLNQKVSSANWKSFPFLYVSWQIRLVASLPNLINNY